MESRKVKIKVALAAPPFLLSMSPKCNVVPHSRYNVKDAHFLKKIIFILLERGIP